MRPHLLFPLAILSCARPGSGPDPRLTIVEPKPARDAQDSVVSAVLSKVVAHSADARYRHTVVIRDDSGVVSGSSLPRLDSIDFVILDSADAQQLADKRGDVNVLTVARPAIREDAARSGFTSRRILQRRPGRGGAMLGLTACAFSLRRSDGRWQVDSTLGCITT